MNTLLEGAYERGYVAAYRILRDQDEARDAYQEAATRALSARDSYDTSRPFYPWFHQILKNHCLDRLRMRKREMSVSEMPVRSNAPSQEQRLSGRQQSEAVTAAIAKLPDELREVIELRHFQDLSYEEIAELLSWPAGTVMSRLYRARKQMRKHLLLDPRFCGDAA